MNEDDVAAQVVDSAIAIHKALRPGLLESAYVAALEIECAERGPAFESEVAIDARYHGKTLGVGYRADLIIESISPIEVKSVTTPSPAHVAQTLSCLRSGRFRLGLVLDFSAPLMKQGIQRVINTF